MISKLICLSLFGSLWSESGAFYTTVEPFAVFVDATSADSHPITPHQIQSSQVANVSSQLVDDFDINGNLMHKISLSFVHNERLDTSSCFLQCQAKCADSKDINRKENLAEYKFQVSEKIGNKLEPGTGSKLRLKLLSTSKTKDLTLRDVCLKDSCVYKSAEIKKRANLTVDPCNNFYQFACGRFLNDVTPDLTSSSVFDQITEDIVLKTNAILQKSDSCLDPPFVKIVKNLYRTCRQSSFRQILSNVLNEIGGWPKRRNESWPVNSSFWPNIAFNWTYGIFVEYDMLRVNVTRADGYDNWILDLKPSIESVDLSTIRRFATDIKDMADVLNLDSEATEEALEEVRVFMLSAVNYALETRDRKYEGIYRLGQLKKSYPHLTILTHLPRLLSDVVVVGDDEMIRVNVKYFTKINSLIRDTPMRTQACYFVMNAMNSLFNLLSTVDDPSTWKSCVKLSFKLYPHSTGRLYAINFVGDASTTTVLNVLSSIRDSFKATLEKNDKIDDIIKWTIVDKLESLKIVVGSFDNEGIVDVDAMNLTEPETLKYGVRNLKLNSYAFLRRNYHKSIVEFVERYLADWYRVNAYYLSKYVFVPISVVNERIVDPQLPEYCNYGGVGFLLGHELMHGIGDGLDRRLSESCLIRQFDKFVLSNGSSTKEENFADLGGFRQSYLAYRKWAERRGQEKRLPGLENYSAKQSFWLVAASNWCSRIDSTIGDLGRRHALPEYRINGELANIPEFAEDFQCHEGAPMNPKEKCTIW